MRLGNLPAYGALCRGIVSILLKGRVLVVFMTVFVLLGPTLVVIRHVTNAIDAAPPFYLMDAPAVPALAEYHPFLHPGGWDVGVVPAPLAAFYATSETSAATGAGLNGLDEIYRILVALLMLLVGANVLPQHEAVYASLFTVPMSKTAQYLLHALALGALCVGLFGLAFLANAATVCAIHGVDHTSLQLLLQFHVFVALYGSLFAFLGLLVSALFRSRRAALLAGMLVVLVIVSVVPHVQNALYFSYRYNHATELRRARLTGIYPGDAMFRLVQVLSLSPSVAYTRSTFHMIYAARYGDSGRCASCWGETRLEFVDRARIALGAMSMMLIVLGGIAFSRKDVKCA